MSLIMRRFYKGIVLRAITDETTIPSQDGEGALFHNSSDSRIKAYIEGAVRQVVTNSQAQVLTNKTINADNNIISNIQTSNLKSGVLNVSTSLTSASDTQIPSALAVKTYVDNSSSGEANTASNLGGGSGIFSTKSGVDLQFKSLVAGSNVTLSSDASTITINSSGGGGSGIPAPTSFSLSEGVSNQPITGLLFSPASVLAFVIEYTIVRTKSSTKVCSVGRFRAIYNSSTSTWLTSDDYAGDNAGVDFSVTAAGQVNYTSTALAGAPPHAGTLKYITLITYAP